MSAGTLTRQGAAVGHGRPRRTWVSYARLSSAKKDDGKGGSLAIPRQHKENRAYVARVDPGARVIELEDDGYSGFLDVVRPGFEQALRMIGAGEVCAFIGWHADRITRQVEVTARLWRVCEARGVAVHTALGGFHEDPDSLYFETMIAERASRQMRNRMRSKHAELAEQSGFTGGHRRFGWNDDGVTIRESEAALIRKMAGRLLGGEALASLARSLNAAGVPTIRGAEGWTATSVRAVLTNPRLIGVRYFQGKRLKASGRPIMDEATFLAVQTYLDRPDRRTTDAGAGKAKHLLTGLAVCDVCDGPVGGVIRKGGALLYRCTGEGCFERRGADIDTAVVEYVVTRLEDLDETGLFESDESNRKTAALVAERDAIPGKRAKHAALNAVGDMDDETLAASGKALTEREAEIGAALAVLAETAAAPKRALEGATGKGARNAWAGFEADESGAGLARRRALIALVADVRIGKAGKGYKGGFNPDSITVDYRPLG